MSVSVYVMELIYIYETRHITHITHIRFLLFVRYSLCVGEYDREQFKEFCIQQTISCIYDAGEFETHN